jgi:hypothetical protein
MPAVPSSPCWRPRPAFGVQCPVRASERPGVGVWCGRPVSVRSRVRCSTGARSWSAAVGQAAAGWDGRGRRGRPPYPRPARRLPKSEHGARSWRRPCWASGGVDPDLAVVVEVVGQWPGRPRADQDRPDAREDRPSGGSRGAQRCSPSCARLRGTSDLHHCCSEPAEDRAPALLRLVSPRQAKQVTADSWRQIAKASSSNATVTRRVTGSSTASLVVPSTEVLGQGVAGDHGPGAAVLLEPAHRPQPRLEATVVGLDVVCWHADRCRAMPPVATRPRPPGRSAPDRSRPRSA